MNASFRIGTTSYIIPADLVPNIEYLAGRVDDVERILFEVEDGPGNLPGLAALERLRAVAATSELSYTVHLPLDINLGAVDAADHPSLLKAVSVIERMRCLDPLAYVVHLEGEDVLAGGMPRQKWLDRTVAALESLGERTGGCHNLAVENLEGYPLDFLDPVLERIDVSCCVDIGHLWLEGHDALSFLAARIDRTRVIHLHCIGTRDHQSLAHMPISQVRSLRELLDREGYAGVVTLEVFNQHDLETSLATFAGAAPRTPESADV